MNTKAEKNAYAKGYQAGRKKRRREEIENQVRNDRATAVVASVLPALLNSGWGSQVDGKHQRWTWDQNIKYAIQAGERVAREMEIHR